jgi:hypothetical protein
MTIEEKSTAREMVKANISSIVASINAALRGEELDTLKPVLQRIGRGGRLPHWYLELESSRSLPNLDGKTIGSVVEMLLVAVLETSVLSSSPILPLAVNPARGVDLPSLDLGVKSPSENYCTSEPFFSAYERLLGSEYDVLVLLTDYQTAKKSPPLRLQVIDCEYLRASQLADRNLCAIGRRQREWLMSDNAQYAKRLMRFLAFVNQSDWQARQLLKLAEVLNEETRISAIVADASADFARLNRKRLREDKPLLDSAELAAVQGVINIQPHYVGVLDAMENWVGATHKDFGRYPNDNEWVRLASGPLDGQIGISFALQWRYNFGGLFGADSDSSEDTE